MKTYLMLEGKVRKCLSKKVKTHYFPLAPGESWSTRFEGQRLLIIADQNNTGPLYVGREVKV